MLDIDRDTFEQLVVQALQTLPAWVHEKMDNVDITVDEVPSAAQIRRLGLPSHATLMGLYEGVPKTRRSHGYGMVLPDKITLFRRPILAACRTPQEVRERIRKVVIHELGHHFGLDENRLRELGAY